MKKSLNVGMLVLGLLCGFSALSLADEVLQPPGRQSWGEANPSDALLNLNRDPEIMKSTDPHDDDGIRAHGTCKDEKGRSFTAEDAEYNACMNRLQRRVAERARAPKVNADASSGQVEKTEAGLTFGH